MNRWILLLLAAAGPAGADPLLTDGGFERPFVRERTPISAGGSPLKSPVNRDWMEFSAQSDSRTGFSAGLAQGFSHTEKQSAYVSFEKFEGKTASWTLASRLIPVQAGAKYRAALWGRNNPDQPLTLDQRAPFLKFFAEFFLADGIANTGDPEIRLQPLPDHRVRLGKHPPLFNSSQWTEFGIDLTAPEDAAFVRITWKIELGRDTGTTHGIFHLDDATLTGPRPLPVPEPADPATESPEKKP